MEELVGTSNGHHNPHPPSCPTHPSLLDVHAAEKDQQRHPHVTSWATQVPRETRASTHRHRTQGRCRVDQLLAVVSAADRVCSPNRASCRGTCGRKIPTASSGRPPRGPQGGRAASPPTAAAQLRGRHVCRRHGRTPPRNGCPQCGGRLNRAYGPGVAGRPYPGTDTTHRRGVCMLDPGWGWEERGYRRAVG